MEDLAREGLMVRRVLLVAASRVASVVEGALLRTATEVVGVRCEAATGAGEEVTSPPQWRDEFD